MNWKTLILPLLLLLSACGNSQETSVLEATAFSSKIAETPEAIVLDVRTPEEYAEGHIDRAVNIDWNSDAFDAEVQQLDKEQPVFVYCLAGGRSTAAVEQMRKLGFRNIYELKGGMLQWRAAKLPETAEVEKASGMSEDDFREELRDERKVLVDFYAEWCGPCKKMAPFLDEIAAREAQTVKVLRIDIDQNPDLAAALNITSLPTLMIVEDGKITWSKIGFAEKEELLGQLK